MKKSELLQRIEALERRVAELEARPQVTYAIPNIYPVLPSKPTPWWYDQPMCDDGTGTGATPKAAQTWIKTEVT